MSAYRLQELLFMDVEDRKDLRKLATFPRAVPSHGTTYFQGLSKE